MWELASLLDYMDTEAKRRKAADKESHRRR
jgi:hypothetical protein